MFGLGLIDISYSLEILTEHVEKTSWQISSFSILMLLHHNILGRIFLEGLDLSDKNMDGKGVRGVTV